MIKWIDGKFQLPIRTEEILLYYSGGYNGGKGLFRPIIWRGTQGQYKMVQNAKFIFWAALNRPSIKNKRCISVRSRFEILDL